VLLHTTTNNKLLHTFGIVQQNCNQQNTKKDFSKKIQNAMHFSLLNYTSKNEKKGHECCQKKNHSKLPIERK